MPAHNYARFLPSAIASLAAQTLREWECIVVDDGSTDETGPVLTRLATQDPRMVCVVQERKGVSASRNVGLRHARGEFIQFLDADDLLSPTKLETHVQALGANADADIVYGPTAYFDEATGQQSWTRSRDAQPALEGGVDGPGPVMLSHLVATNPMTIEAPLLRRSILDRAGWFDEGLDRMEDWDLWLRVALAGARFAFVPAAEPVALIRLHNASASSAMAPMLVSMIAVRQKMRTKLSSRKDRALNDRLLDELRAHVGKLIGLGGHPMAGLRIVLPAILSGRRPRGLKTAVRLMAELTGAPQLLRAARAKTK